MGTDVNSEVKPSGTSKHLVLVAFQNSPQISLKEMEAFFRPVTLQEFKRDQAKYCKEIEGIIYGPFLSSSLKIDRDLLDQMPKLKVISLNSVGYDYIDVQLCKECGIKVCNNRDIQSDACADLVMFLMLAVSRRAITGYLKYKEDTPSFLRLTLLSIGRDVTGSSIGILGMGSIGCRVAERAKGFRMKILYHNRKQRSVQDDADLGAVYVPNFMDMLPQLDFLVDCCPLSSATSGLIGAKAFVAMKSSAILVNISRGAVVDTYALVDALQRGVIGGAGLDVTSPEPLPQGHPLFDLPNVVITPHIGSATIETSTKLDEACLQNTLDGIEGRPILSLL